MHLLGGPKIKPKPQKTTQNFDKRFLIKKNNKLYAECQGEVL